jgi:hypothetical protein
VLAEPLRDDLTDLNDLDSVSSRVEEGGVEEGERCRSAKDTLPLLSLLVLDTVGGVAMSSKNGAWHHWRH